MDTDVLFLVMASTALIFTVYYWMNRSLVGGLLSILSMFATGSYWLILGTTLPILAWVWYIVAISSLYDFIYRSALTFGNQIADKWGYRWDFLRRAEDE